MGTGRPSPRLRPPASAIATLWPEHSPAPGSHLAPCPWALPNPEMGADEGERYGGPPGRPEAWDAHGRMETQSDCYWREGTGNSMMGGLQVPGVQIKDYVGG